MKSSNLYLITLILAIIDVLPLKANEDQDSVGVRLYEKAYSSQWAIDTSKVEQLTLSLNSTLFFRDNEFDNPMIRGYTLPGFRLQPTVGYKPNKHVNIELGMYMLRFWGTDEYPNLAYSDIAYWKGREKAATGVHLLPFFRVQFANDHGLNVVLGSIYGARYHNLLEPLYAPELNLTADPEAGAQILYSNKWLDFDTWVNWESFIYKGDTHQEAFTFGVSSTLKYNSPESRLHLYTPVQVLFQHRGGEIDTLYTNSVQTLFNGAIGLGARFDVGRRALRRVNLEADLLGYNQQVGDIWPIRRGWALYAHATFDVERVRFRLGYYHSHNFVSLFGYPFFGDMSMSDPDLTFKSRKMLFMGFNYNWRIAPGYTLGTNAEVYRHFGATGYKKGEAVHYGPTLGFGGSLYIQINPSFILKSFRKQ